MVVDFARSLGDAASDLCGGQRHESLGELSLQLVEYWGSKAPGAAADNAGNLPAAGLAAVADLVHSWRKSTSNTK